MGQFGTALHCKCDVPNEPMAMISIFVFILLQSLSYETFGVLSFLLGCRVTSWALVFQHFAKGRELCIYFDLNVFIWLVARIANTSCQSMYGIVLRGNNKKQIERDMK